MEETIWRIAQDNCEEELEELPCFNVVGEDGHYIGTMIIPRTDYCKLCVQCLAELSNSLMPGKD